MRFRKLSEIAPSGASPAKPEPDETVWHLTLDQIEPGSGKIGRRSYGRASEAGASTFVFDTQNVLYSKLRPYLNKVVCPDSSGIATTELVPLRPIPGELNREFLCFYLRSPEFVSWASAQVDGAKMPRMKMKSFWAHEMPLPPLGDQIRIAHLLGKVEGLIAQREKHLQQLDDLLKSVFLEMFGDPVRNEKGWNIELLEKAVLDISSGTSYGGEDRPFGNPEEIGVLKISAVTRGTFDPAEFKVVNRALITKPLRFVKRGDFLFSRANTIQLVAACCIVPEDYDRLFLPDKLWVLTLNEKLVKPQFLNYLLKNERYRDVVRALASGGHDSMLNISMKKFMTLDIPCPPDGLQKQFTTIVEKVESLKYHYQQSLTDLETIYGVLSQQAFKGELDLSRVTLPAAFIGTESPVAVAAPTPNAAPVIKLPETDLLLPALQDRTQLEPLLRFWLEAHRTQLGSAAFSLERFIAAAQARLAELHPDDDFEWAASDYEFIKTWVFEALVAGALTQAFDDESNRIEIKAAAEQSLA